jgi:hypothetical protein
MMDISRYEQGIDELIEIIEELEKYLKNRFLGEDKNFF